MQNQILHQRRESNVLLVLTAAQAGLICCKIAGVVAWSWWLVVLPLWCTLLGLFLILLLLCIIGAGRIASGEKFNDSKGKTAPGLPPLADTASRRIG
jgi:hypothetical protein